MWHVKDVRDVILIFIECNAIYVKDVKDRLLKHVKDVEDRSNTPKGCNAVYVKDVEDGKRTYTHIFALNFLNIQPIFNLQKGFEKLRLRAFQPYHLILCISKHVKDVKDRSNTPKHCNAVYVEDIEDGKRTYTYI